MSPNVIVIDDFMSPGLLRAVASSWPEQTSSHWHAYHDRNSVKLASRCWDGMPRAAQTALAEMAKIDVESLLGFPECFPDLDGLNGSGLHSMSAGGKLGLHLDAEFHPLRPWRRVASAVLYLDQCDGGQLELCEPDGTVIRDIEPQFNRLALFACPGAWHRVAECRSLRRSLCLFWWVETQWDSQGQAGAMSATFA